jgi:hypothetical protein
MASLFSTLVHGGMGSEARGVRECLENRASEIQVAGALLLVAEQLAQLGVLDSALSTAHEALRLTVNVTDVTLHSGVLTKAAQVLSRLREREKAGDLVVDAVVRQNLN